MFGHHNYNESFYSTQTAILHKYHMRAQVLYLGLTYCLLFLLDVAVCAFNFPIIFLAVDTYRCSGKKEKREEEERRKLSKL